jgi:hypothetical protein
VRYSKPMTIMVSAGSTRTKRILAPHDIHNITPTHCRSAADHWRCGTCRHSRTRLSLTWTSTTLADLLTPLLVANPFSAMRASLRR